MKKYENAQDELRSIYDQARSTGRVHTQREFAELVGINPTNLSAIFNGAVPLTEQMLRRIREAAQVAGIINADGSAVNVNSPQATAIVGGIESELLQEMKAQREMYAEHTRMYFEQIKQLTETIATLANRK